MTDEKYAVVFRGDIVMGQTLPEVKQRLQSLFKADSARIDSLFSGKPVPIKSSLSQADAERYQQLLRKAGAVVSVEPVVAKAKQAPASKEPTSSASVEAQAEVEPSWQLAPVGSLLGQLQSSKHVVEVNVDHLDVLPQQGNLIKEGERATEPDVMFDVDALDWELSPYGEALLKAEERNDVVAVEVDISQLSLAEQDGDLLDESEKQQPVTSTIDTSHLRLQD